MHPAIIHKIDVYLDMRSAPGLAQTTPRPAGRGSAPTEDQRRPRISADRGSALAEDQRADCQPVPCWALGLQGYALAALLLWNAISLAASR